MTPVTFPITVDGLWRTGYRSICNVARLKPAAMKREMPVRRWKNLPEAAEIPALLRARDESVEKMRAEVLQDLRRAAKIAADSSV